MSNYDFNKHKKGDKVKWFFTGLAFFLVIVTIVGMCLQLWGTGKVKPSEWFKHEETEQSSPDTETENTELSAGGATITDGESNGMLLSATAIPLNAYEEYGVSALADNAYTITATITPADADNQLVDYSIAWKNSSSTWASGKNISDYLTIEQSSDGSKTAVLTCNQAFAEQAIVTVTSRAVSTVKATATVDYLKKLLDVTGGLFDGNTSAIKTWDTTSGIAEPTNYSWSIGTIEDTIKTKTFTIGVTDTLKSSLNSSFTSSTDRAYYANPIAYTSPMTWDMYDNGIFTCDDQSANGMNGCVKGLFGFCSELVDYGEVEMLSTKYNKLRTCLQSCSSDLVVNVSVVTNGGSSYTASYNVNIDDSALEIMPTAVILSLSTIQF